MTRIEISLVHGFAMIESRKQIRKAAVQYSIPNVSFVRTLLLQHIEMLRDARTAGLVKPRCGDGTCRQGLVWAVLTIQTITDTPDASSSPQAS
jgi:hypothetical protein